MQVVFIIGAPRSGTNMLRDVVTKFDSVSTWQCDEINYILRHGNARFSSDEFPPQLARSSVKKYLQRKFSRFGAQEGAKVLVEKTCANSLRVAFLNEVFPDAKFLFIHRDGIDAAGSALLRWKSKVDLGYIFQKVRYVPLSDVPYYGCRFLWAKLYQLFSKEKRLAYWGPTLNNMQEILEKHSLNEVCTVQWQQCVEKADHDLNEIGRERVYRLSYEKFVNKPQEILSEILAFIDIEPINDEVEMAVRGVSNRSLGKGRASLGVDEVRKLEALAGTTLKKFDYL
jgi:hypothetical protein